MSLGSIPVASLAKFRRMLASLRRAASVAAAPLATLGAICSQASSKALPMTFSCSGPINRIPTATKQDRRLGQEMINPNVFRLCCLAMERGEVWEPRAADGYRLRIDDDTPGRQVREHVGSQESAK